ncbi:MAG: aminotransferase class I/II-fold pyridoxal phosphate-dependent enzyme [Jatrophihabitantaceae bacterium]
MSPLLGVPVLELTAKGIATAIARAVRDQSLAEGALLPPIRSVASELGVSPTTVAAAWQLLARSGVIVSSGRRGTIIAPRSTQSSRYRRAVDPASNVQLDLSTGVPDPRLLPDLSSAVRALTEAVAPGSYLDPPVLADLDRLIRTTWPFDVPGLTVVDGAMDALDLTARVLFGFGDRVIVETPYFPPMLDLLESHRVDIVAVGLDEDGIDLHGVQDALAVPTRAVIVQPRAQNPTGVSMTTRRAHQLSKLLAPTDTIIIEDESWAAVARAEPVSLGVWLPQQTVHIRSFSKSHGPDLRIAAMSGPEQLMREISALRQNGQGWTSRILQRILLELLTDPVAITAVEHARTVYAQRRTNVVNALAAEHISVTGTDGFNIWIPVADETSAILCLANHGIGAAPGAPFQVHTSLDPHIRITVSSLDRGYAHVAAAIAEAARGSQRPVV